MGIFVARTAVDDFVLTIQSDWVATGFGDDFDDEESVSSAPAPVGVKPDFSRDEDDSPASLETRAKRTSSGLFEKHKESSSTGVNYSTGRRDDDFYHVPTLSGFRKTKLSLSSPFV